MSSIPQVSQAMQTILSTRATALERSTGFVQRSSVQFRAFWCTRKAPKGAISCYTRKILEHSYESEK